MAFKRMPRLAEMLRDDAGHADFSLGFGRDAGGQARVLGHITAKLVVQCQRCLEPMEVCVEREVRLTLVGENDDLASLDAACEPLLVGDEPVPLPGIVEDELILAMPNFSRHPRSRCEMPPGADAADVPEDSAPGDDIDTGGESGEDNPFSVLESLKPRKTP
jgi:uncharacterized protein